MPTLVYDLSTSTKSTNYSSYSRDPLTNAYVIGPHTRFIINTSMGVSCLPKKRASKKMLNK